MLTFILTVAACLAYGIVIGLLNLREADRRRRTYYR